MQKKDVPQDDGLNMGMLELTYAVDENGRYNGVQSLGWEPKNIVNTQAWDVIEEEVKDVYQTVRTGKQSPLAYHCAKHLMTIELLASYVCLPRWRVKRHFRQCVFKRLKSNIIKRYADVFGITPEELQKIPDTDFSLLEDAH